MIAGRTSAVTAAAVVVLTAPPSAAQARRSDEVLASAARASPASASDIPLRLVHGWRGRTGSTTAGIFPAVSAPADPVGQFGRNVRLYRGHGPERFPQVGPGQRV